MFFARRDLVFFIFFLKFQKHNEPCTGRRVRAKFRAYPSGDSLGIVAAEKKAKQRLITRRPYDVQ